jgi:serine/threonine-protein phosphatase 2A regulatory subunit B
MCNSNVFRVFGAMPGSEEASTLEASKTPNRRLMPTPARPGSRVTTPARGRRDNRRVGGSESPGSDMNGGVYDFTSKLLHLAWHPTSNVIACAASNSLYMYYA